MQRDRAEAEGLLRKRVKPAVAKTETPFNAREQDKAQQNIKPKYKNSKKGCGCGDYTDSGSLKIKS